MNPLSALIGAGGSLLGSWMNTSSQQAINAANLQFATTQASGGFLPQQYANLVKGANAAGLSPLAVLGYHGASGFPGLVAPQPGEGIKGAGEALSSNVLHTQRMQDIEYERARVDLANNKQLGNNAAIRGAVDAYIAERMRSDPTVLPPGLTERSVPNEWMRKFWNNPFQLDWQLDGGRVPPPPPGPTFRGYPYSIFESPGNSPLL